MAKTKTKMISVRVSEDDYVLLKAKYELHGTRSVSALAREALHSVLRPGEGKPLDLHIEVGMLHSKINTLHNEVARLSRLLSENLLAINKATE